MEIREMNINKNRNSIFYYIKITIILLVLFSGSLNNTTLVRGDEEVLPKGTVINEDLSGKTKEEALVKLTELGEKLKEKTITIKFANGKKEVKYNDFKVVFNFEEALDKIIDKNYDGEIVVLSYDSRYLTRYIRNLVKENPKGFSLHKAEELGDKIASNLNLNPENYVIDMTVEWEEESELSEVEKKQEAAVSEDGNPGIKITKNEKSNRGSNTSSNTQNQGGSETLKNPKLLVTYKSEYKGSTADRATNIIRAAEEINGKILKPGQIFSFNNTVNNVTEENGYKEGLIYSGSDTVVEVGGGICQVSSALYNVVLKSGIKIVERYNHGSKVAYQNYGMDATVYAPSLDFKFQNSFPYTVEIKAYNKDKVLYIELWGDTTEELEYTYEYETVVTNLKKSKWVYKEDKKIAKGDQQIRVYPIEGATATVYKKTIKNGKVIKKEHLYTDYYRPLNGIILVHPGEIPPDKYKKKAN